MTPSYTGKHTAGNVRFIKWLYNIEGGSVTSEDGREAPVESVGNVNYVTHQDAKGGWTMMVLQVGV